MSQALAAIALLGIESNCADAGSCARVRPPWPLDRLQPQCPVRSHARQHDADGTLPLVAGKRAEQHVDWQPQAAGLDGCSQMQEAADNSKFGVRRDYVDPVGFDRH